ncbi:DUF3192 domain-containing protein [Shewanella algae]|uniref:DUF3192 domain-containing protein n=1 Tax=Shewanella algae TaxID=38313 RepID=UPI002936CDA2|nr:DUF3192 domain-containing protein [Shewanella algae]MDV2963475.1 DUF3192 domain-containing protein [Shewanella algae]
MKGKAPVVIGSIFIAYLVFVAVVILFYEPKPEDMSWEDRQAYNQSKVTELLLGQTLEQTIETLGRADFSEAMQTHGQSLQVLFYRTHHVKSDGKTTKDECTPLLFANGRLQAWGEDTYQQYLQQHMQPQQTTPQQTQE